MAKKPSGFAGLASEAAKAKPAPAPIAVPELIEDEPMLPINAPRVPKVRRGKKIIAGYFPPELQKAVRLLAVEQDSTVEAMLGEALNMLLRHYGKHPQAMK